MKITIKNVEKLLNVSADKIYQWIKKEEIPYIKIGDNYYFDKVELFEWANINGIRVSTELFEDNISNLEKNIIYNSINRGGVYYNIKGNDIASVLKSMVNVLNLPEDIDKDFLYEILLARESLGSTGIGNGIAIPHPRNPVVLNISEPIISLCFLENSIDFKAIDTKPVNILFLIISGAVNIHLKMLSKLAYMLTNKEFIELLNKKANQEEIFNMIKKLEEEINNKK